MSAAHVESMLDLEIPENPFPGLRPFEFNESLLYFGRDGQSEQLLRKLSATRFLAVVGTSGSGKSSLVRAGLLPALLGGFMTSAGSNWHIALMRPGFDPIGNLARALAAPEVLGSNGDQEVLAAMAESTLRRGSLGLMDLAQQAKIGANQNLLIVADQFEELFRVAGFAESEAYRNHAAAFVKLLLEASRQRELPIYVVLTMRSDFLGDCSSFWGLPEAINEGQYLIPRLTREQRREAITGPIAVCGGAITDRLVNRLLNDMGDDQDQLPLLQHALMRTWGKWKETGGGPAIDLEHYESIGGMSDALSLHADEAFNTLPDDRSRQIAEKAFKGLTEKGPDNREMRRPVTLATLSVLTGAGESELAQVIDTFRGQDRSFLMPPSQVPLTSSAMIDISHESLIRNWRRLKGWVDEEARSARIYRRLAETAALHREGKAGLWRDPDLQVALTWREQTQPNKEWGERYHPDFDEAMRFLDESLAERGAEQLARAREAEAREKQIRSAKQIRNARLITGVLGVAFMICLGTLVYANRQRNEAILRREQANQALADAHASELLAREEKARAEEEKKKAEASAKLAEENGRAALAQKARADAQTVIAEQLARQATSAKEKALHFLYGADLNLAQRTHDAKDIARADELLTEKVSKDYRGFEWYHLWNRYHRAEHTIKGYDRSLTSVAFSPTQKNLLATSSADGTLALFDSISGKSESLLKTSANSVWKSIFSPDGDKLAVLGDSNTIELWDVASKKNLGTLPKSQGDPLIECIAFWQEGKLVAGNQAGTITVWDIEAPHNKQTIRYPGEQGGALPDVVALAGSPKTDILAAGYEDGVLRIWNPASDKYSEPQFNQGKITSLAMSSDGKLLAVATQKGWLAIWATGGVFRQEAFAEGKEQWKPLFEKQLLPEGLNCLAFSEDGRMLATGGADGAVTFWSVEGFKIARTELDSLEQQKQSAKTDAQLKSLEQELQTLKKDVQSLMEPGGGGSLPLEHSGPITCIAFSHNGQMFASGSSDRTVKVWDLAKGKNEENGIISPDGHLVATVDPDDIKVFEAGRVRSKFPIDRERKVRSMVFSPDNNAIVAGLDSDTMKLYHVKTGKEIELSKGKQFVSSNGKYIADWDGDLIRVWDASRGEVLHQFLPRAGFRTHSHAFSPDSKAVAVGYADGTAKLYYLETAEEFEIEKMGRGDQVVSFTPDSKFLRRRSTGRPSARPRSEQVVPKTWNVEERRLVRAGEPAIETQSEEEPAVVPVRATVAGKIASAESESITLTDVATKKTNTKTKTHLGRVTALAFSHDGKILASGGLDGTVKLWDANRLEQLEDIAALKKTNGTLNRISNLAFSTDDKRLAMGTETQGGTLVLWDLSARQELLRLSETTLPASSAFSKDDMALGSQRLGRILMGALETDRVTSITRESGDPPFTWVSSRSEVAIPGNALIAGHSYEQDVFLHVCRVRYNNNTYVGYTWGDQCHIGDVGPERGHFNFGSYDVLVNADSTSWLLKTNEGSRDRSYSKPLKIVAGKLDDGRDVAICRGTDYSGFYIGWTEGEQCHISNGTITDRFEILHKRGIESATAPRSRRGPR